MVTRHRFRWLDRHQSPSSLWRLARAACLFRLALIAIIDALIAPGDNFHVKIYDFPFPIEIGSVCDLDFLPDGTSLTIQGSEAHQVILLGQRRLTLPEGWSCPEFPFIRYLPCGRFLVVDTGYAQGGEKNAWLMDQKGRIEAHFEIGSAAVEIAGLWSMIAVAYHPLSAKAHGHQIQPLQRTGIAFFDTNGRLLMGFNQEAARYGIAIENVRCMTALSRSQLLFVPERLWIHGQEVENPVVLFDFATRKPRVFSAPHPRAEAVTMEDGSIHLASPEGWEDQIITFDAETKISQHRGEFLGVFRGLEGGAFLAQLSASDYAVIVPGFPEKLRRRGELAGSEETILT